MGIICFSYISQDIKKAGAQMDTDPIMKIIYTDSISYFAMFLKSSSSAY